MSRQDAIRFLADRLESEETLLATAAQQAADGAYRVILVPRGDGRMRELAEPPQELKQVQALVLHRLLDLAPVPPFAHGFIRGRSIVTNARVHLGATSMVNVDIQDAFPSVKTARVRETVEWRLGPLLKHVTPAPSRQLLTDTYDLIAALCTFKDCLPQGAPTSGSLLNLACARLDRLVGRRLLRDFANRHGIRLRYTRYADDLTITSENEIPATILDELGRLVLQAGFELNRRKSHQTSTRAGDLVICGVRLAKDGTLAIPRRTLREYRALCDHALAFDPSTIPADVKHRVTGVLGFLRMVYAAPPPLLEKPLARLLQVHREWLPGGRLPAPEWWQLPYGIPQPGDAEPGPPVTAPLGPSGQLSPEVRGLDDDRGGDRSPDTAPILPDTGAWPGPGSRGGDEPLDLGHPDIGTQPVEDEDAGFMEWGLTVGVILMIFIVNWLGGC